MDKGKRRDRSKYPSLSGVNLMLIHNSSMGTPEFIKSPGEMSAGNGGAV